jgi:hypothetical protein
MAVAAAHDITEERRRTLESVRADAERKWKEAEGRAQAADARAREAEARAQAAETRAHDAEARAQEAAARAQGAEARAQEAASELDRTRAGGEPPEPGRSPVPETAAEPDAKPVRGANRYSFSKKLEVRIDSHAGVLVDLSVTGAQVLLSSAVKVNHVASVSLPSDETPVSCKGRIIWVKPEPPSKTPVLYRAGILFVASDEAAVEAFIIRHSASRRPNRR